MYGCGRCKGRGVERPWRGDHSRGSWALVKEGAPVDEAHGTSNARDMLSNLVPIAELFGRRKRSVSVKHLPLAVRQNKDDGLGKSCGERSAVRRGCGRRTLAGGKGNCWRQQCDMLLVKSVVHLLQPLKSLFRRCQSLLAGEEELAVLDQRSCVVFQHEAEDLIRVERLRRILNLDQPGQHCLLNVWRGGISCGLTLRDRDGGYD